MGFFPELNQPFLGIPIYGDLIPCFHMFSHVFIIPCGTQGLEKEATLDPRHGCCQVIEWLDQQFHWSNLNFHHLNSRFSRFSQHHLPNQLIFLTISRFHSHLQILHISEYFFPILLPRCSGHVLCMFWQCLCICLSFLSPMFPSFSFPSFPTRDS